jgi:dTDP-4-amino-4,6-dideoxygalactose transaminase
MIHVTQPSLAPLEEFTELLRGVWERGILTHNGPLVQQLEMELCASLGLNNFVAVSNGTIAIQMAIKALGLSGSGGEILTTPFTWVATLSAIQWEGCKPTFCDIDPHTFNMDPAKIEQAITPRTVAIMPVHVFGNPCDVEKIEAIAKKHGLRVIYDAAHAVGSTFNGESLLSWGDISATSMHATKMLNTAEGGGCIACNSEIHEKLKRIRFFGHNDAKEIVEEGFNGKMTEVHAALGLANLRYHGEVLADRKKKYMLYKELLGGDGRFVFQEIRTGEPNFSYFPVLFQSEQELLAAQSKLTQKGIVPRRYFYPSVNTLGAIVPDAMKMPISEDIAARILCLPLYWKLQEETVARVCEVIRNAATKS